MRASGNFGDSETSHALCALEHHNDGLGEEVLTPGEDGFLASAPVPEVSRMLRDSKGKFCMRFLEQSLYLTDTSQRTLANQPLSHSFKLCGRL
jgi:hypothetical protein